MTRDFHLPAARRFQRRGVAATSHPLATLAAIETLRAGGNAVDAAVTAIALLSVLEPHMTGIGGDCFCLVARPEEPVWGYNGSGRAGAGMRAQSLIEQGIRAIDMNSIHAVTVPGAIEAWSAILQRHGRFGLDRALAPAIRAAEDGVSVAPRVGSDWALAMERLRADPGAKRHFLPGGAAPITGDVVRMPALAATLKRSRKAGARLYEGWIAQDIVATVSERGGVLTVGDFASHRGEDAIPISANYRGLDVVEIPPNSQGLAALLLLKILEQFDLAALDPQSPERLHIALEPRGRLCGRDTHIADPPYAHFEPHCVTELCRRTCCAHRPLAARTAAQWTAPRGDTYWSRRRSHRMAVSRSIRVSSFARHRDGENRDLLHNRGWGFVLDPGHPNCIGPNKRPLHTILPGLAMREGRCEMTFGVMGGGYQAMGQANFISNVVDHGMDVQAAIDCPRVFFEGEKTMIERGVPAAAMKFSRAAAE